MKKLPTTTRRELLIKGSASMILGSVLSRQVLASTTDVAQNVNMNEQKPFRFSAASEKFMSMFDLKYPIVQAPAGGVVTSDLVAAVCNAGCLGGLPLSWSNAKSAKKSIAEIQSKTKGTFFANFVLNFEPVALLAAVEAGVKAIQFSWGMPTIAQVKSIKSSNVILGIQVTDEESASQALKLGADYLVCQGVEAGGHVHASRPLENALKRVLSVAGKVPVIASGGVATGNDIHRLLLAGAAGVVMGTRFVATRESGAHQQYKDSLITAKSEDTVFTTCMNKGWDGATHRILRNSTFREWSKFGCPKVGSRPGEHDKIARYGDAPGDKFVIERYSIDSPGRSINGDIEALANYAGKGVDNINDIPSVADLVSRIWKEFENC
jgi:nitronate monooxygenase